MKHPHHNRVAILVLLAVGMMTVPAVAQTTDPGVADAPHKKPVKKPPRDKYGSPLNTFMTTHLTTDVPEAEGFVRRSRPAARDLDYTPLTGTDPDRPKPRDKANIEALQAELEQAGAAAQAKGALGRGQVKAARKKVKAAE